MKIELKNWRYFCVETSIRPTVNICTFEFCGGTFFFRVRCTATNCYYSSIVVLRWKWNQVANGDQFKEFCLLIRNQYNFKVQIKKFRMCSRSPLTEQIKTIVPRRLRSEQMKFEREYSRFRKGDVIFRSTSSPVTSGQLADEVGRISDEVGWCEHDLALSSIDLGWTDASPSNTWADIFHTGCSNTVACSAVASALQTKWYRHSIPVHLLTRDHWYLVIRTLHNVSISYKKGCVSSEHSWLYRFCTW